MDRLSEACLLKANELITRGYVKGVDLFQLCDTLIALELEKREKNEKSDCLLDYNDEIVSIEDVGEIETTDISVSGDNLFYCNDILTKNSFGLPATADIFLALISTEQLEAMNQLMIKQLKNRYDDISKNKRFTVGLDRAKMRLYDIADPTANLINTVSPTSTPVISSPFASKSRKVNDFKDFTVE